MKKNLETMRKINKAKRHLAIFYSVLAIFFVVTIFLLFSSIYICKGAVYDKKSGSALGSSGYSYSRLFEIDGKITFANLAFGFENSKDDSIVPVEKDVRLLLLYIAQIFVYLLLLLKLVKNRKFRLYTGIITSVAIIVVAVATIVFMNGYQKDLQLMFDESINTLRETNLYITKIDDPEYPSRIIVSLSTIPAIICAYMVISGGCCLYTTILENYVSKNEVLNARKK